MPLSSYLQVAIAQYLSFLWLTIAVALLASSSDKVNGHQIGTLPVVDAGRPQRAESIAAKS